MAIVQIHALDILGSNKCPFERRQVGHSRDGPRVVCGDRGMLVRAPVKITCRPGGLRHSCLWGRTAHMQVIDRSSDDARDSGHARNVAENPDCKVRMRKINRSWPEEYEHTYATYWATTARPNICENDAPTRQ